MKEIRFDDIDALKAEISEDFGDFGREVEVSQDKIQQFADVTGDHQWIHLDQERCEKESPFKTTIAHGFLTLSLLPSLGGRSEYAIVGHGNVTNYGSDGFRFLSPVPTGSKVHARSRLAAIEAKPKGTLVTTETAIHVVGSERPALVYKGLAMYQGVPS